MIQEGTSLINQSYFDSVNSSLDKLANGEQALCAEIQKEINKIYSVIQAKLNSLLNQATKLVGSATLIKPPTDLPSCISWIENQIKQDIVPLYQMYLNIVATQAAITNELATISSKIGSIASCGLTTPAINIPTLPVPSVQPVLPQ